MSGIFDFIQGKSTSKNMTVLGIALIIGAVASVAVPMLDGDPLTAPDWKAAGAMFGAGIVGIIGKGAASTGGTVAETAEAAKRVGAG